MSIKRDPETGDVTMSKMQFVLLSREANINNRPLMRHLTNLATYLGIGALVHAWLIGPTFDNHDLWSWAYLLAWPIPLIGWLVAALAIWAFYAVILIVVCAVLWWAIVTIHDRRRKRERGHARGDDWLEPR